MEVPLHSQRNEHVTQTVVRRYPRVEILCFPNEVDESSVCRQHSAHSHASYPPNFERIRCLEEAVASMEGIFGLNFSSRWDFWKGFLNLERSISLNLQRPIHCQGQGLIKALLAIMATSMC